MTRRTILGGCISTCAALVRPLLAQEGHPLTGTWHGEWNSSPTQKTRLVLYLKYDGKDVTGMLNPGPRAVPLKAVTVDPSKWMIHFEAETKDPSGQTVQIVGDGKLDDIGSYNRHIAGTWMQGSAKGDFRITRD